MRSWQDVKAERPAKMTDADRACEADAYDAAGDCRNRGRRTASRRSKCSSDWQIGLTEPRLLASSPLRKIRCRSDIGSSMLTMPSVRDPTHPRRQTIVQKSSHGDRGFRPESFGTTH